MRFVRQALGQACKGAEEAAGAGWCLAGVVVWGSLDPLPLSLRIGAAPAVFLLGRKLWFRKGVPSWSWVTLDLTFIFCSNVSVRDVFV